MHASSKSTPAGQASALWMSTIAFTACFAVWTIFSIIGIQIKKDLGLNETEFGLLVGTPILTGSLIRLMLGIWTDQYGGRLVYTLVMLSAAVATWLLTYAYDIGVSRIAEVRTGPEQDRRLDAAILLRRRPAGNDAGCDHRGHALPHGCLNRLNVLANAAAQ
jgi:MFS family permease